MFRILALGSAGLALLTLILLACTTSSSVGSLAMPFKSPFGVALDAKARRAYVALHTADAVAVVNLKTGNIEREIPVGKGPRDIALANRKAYAVCEHDDLLFVIDRTTGKVKKRIAVGQSPRGVAVHEGDNRVYVTSHDEKKLYRVDGGSGKTSTLDLPGWPNRVITHRVNQHPCLLTLSTLPGRAIVSLIDAGEGFRTTDHHVLRGVTNARGLAGVDGPGSVTVVAHQNPKTNIPTTQISQGWVFTNAVSSFQFRRIGNQIGRRPGISAVFDSPQRAYADPSDVVIGPKQQIFVLSAGADRVLILDNQKMAAAEYNQLAPDGTKKTSYFSAREDLTLSRKFVVAKIPTGANPRRMALSADGETLVVSNYLDDSLTIIDVPSQKVRQTISLGGPPLTAARPGERLFHSNKMTQLGQFTCASCHPEGHTDGLSWDLTRDGIANFMNTRSLRGVKDTAGYGWYSSSPTLKDRIAGTLRNLHNHEPTPQELSDIAAYLQTLTPLCPLPKKELDVEAIARGKALFAGKAKCAGCHSGPTYQDGLTHNIGTKRPQDISAKFDTPSLRGAAYTAPYLHDGRAASLSEVFTKHNSEQRHGAAHSLNEKELADLVVFLQSQ